MTKNKPKLSVLCLIAALIACADLAKAATDTESAAAPVDKITELFGDPVIAKGGGIEVKRSELDEATLNVKSMYAARGQAIPPQYMTMLEQQMLARVIHLKLLLKKATEADRTSGKNLADERYDTLVKRSGSQETLDLQIKARGMTRDEFRSKLADEAAAEIVAERDLNITVSDEEAKKFYEEHPSQFEQPERVHAAHILLLTVDPVTQQPLSADKKAEKRKLMEDILKRARNGEDFSKLVSEFSEDPVSKENNGEITFPRGAQGIPPEFEAAAFILGTNQISDIITSAYAFHIVKVLDKLPAKTLAYEEVADDLKDGLKQQAMVDKMPEYMAKLRKEANVEILDEKLVPEDDPAEETASDPVTTGATGKTEDPK